MAKIASTVYESGPDDSLATADAYSGPGNDYGRAGNNPSVPTSSATDSRGKVKDTTVEKSRNSSVSVTNILSAVSAGLAGRNNQQLSQRASRATGSPSAYNSLPSSLREEILYDLSGGALGRRGDVRTTVSGAERLLNTAQLDDARGISNFLVNLTGNNQLASTLDIAGEMAVFNQVLRKAIDLGVVEVIDTLWEEAKDRKRAKQMLIGSLRLLAFTSNLAGINKVLDYIGRQEALAREPNLIQYIMTFYKIPDGKGRANYESLWQDLKGTLDRVDPKWDKYQREGNAVGNLDPFTYASQDALILFQRKDQYRTTCLIAPVYRSRQLVQLARQNYPQIGLI